MKDLLSLLITATLAALPLSSAHAAIDPKIVSADARWLVHIDFNLLRESQIGRDLLALAAKNHAPSPDAPVTVDFNKVLATVGKATAYGANFAHNPEMVDGTLVIEGTPDLRKIAEGYIAQATVSTPDNIIEVKGLPFETYSVGGDVLVGFPKEQIILVSKVKSHLLRAYELYTGKGESMAKVRSSPLRDLISASRESFLVAGSVVPGETIAAADGGPQTRIIKMAQAASINLGEKDRLTFAKIRLIANSAETADKLQKIVQGLTAMASLAHSNNQDIEQFMQSATVERQDLAVLLNLSYPSDRLISMVEQMRQQHTRVERHEAKPVGKVLAEWKADGDFGSDQPTDKTRTVREVENVHLSAGAIIRVSGKRDAGEHARLDYLEIEDAGGTRPALKFEAEYMKLDHYEVEKVPAASGGKVIIARGDVSDADLQFPGQSGQYNVKVHYLDETDGKSSFSLRLIEPTEDSKD